MKILLIHQEGEKRLLIQQSLEDHGLQVRTTAPGRKISFPEAEGEIQLILLELKEDRLPEGFKLIEDLKENPVTASIPVITVNGNDPLIRREAFLKGAIGAVSDPFLSDELIPLIKSILHQMESLKPRNFVTGLPGGPLIEQELNRRIDRGDRMAVICIAINQIKSFAEKYGLETMDEVVRDLALVIRLAFHQKGLTEAFVGHFDLNDFILVTPADSAEEVCEGIVRIFEREFKLLHYGSQDREAGCMLHTSRRGEPLRIPFISLAIGIASNDKKAFSNGSQAIRTALEVQKRALALNRSAYFKDQRTVLIDGR